jgi:hypothetical protein
MVGTDLSVYLNTPLHADLHALLVGESILEPVTKDNSEGKALTLLVGTSSCLGCPDTSHLSEAPMLGCVNTLQVLLVSVWPERVKGMSSSVSNSVWRAVDQLEVYSFTVRLDVKDS